MVLSSYLFDIKNEKKIITVYGAILMYTLNDLADSLGFGDSTCFQLEAW